jgi:hydroxymethylpyrimidine pyrophosphatase-like HAD family hydrolase
MTATLYVDVDGTLVGPGGDLLHGESTAVVEALVRCRREGVTVVPVSGRGRVQVRELNRLLGFGRGIGELGCLTVEGGAVTYHLGEFTPSEPGASPVADLMNGGLEAALAVADLEPHDPWNEDRHATFLVRGEADVAVVDRALADAGFGWCHLVDNGRLRRGGRVYHLAPRGTGKAGAVARDRDAHGLSRDDVAYIGDSAADLACGAEVSRLFLVGNAGAELEGERTVAEYGEGVAEAVARLLDSPR